MNMRLFLYGILTIGTNLGFAYGGPMIEEWGTVSNKVQMQISLKGGERAIGTNEVFELQVRLRNLSETNSFVLQELAPCTEPGSGIHCEITAPSGKDVSPKVEYRGFATGGVNIRPHTMEEFDFELSDICKFTEVGTYKIIASKGMSRDKSEPWIVVSNPLLVTVVATNSTGMKGTNSSQPQQGNRN